jgi:hypothetical protein
MNDIRAKFEEIWPVPAGVFWSKMHGKYRNDLGYDPEDAYDANLRLDTFTRCQEYQALVVTLIDDLVYDLERAYNNLKRGTTYNTHSLDRAKKLIGK